jgi:diguanylate cyclase (GGDEF)-like protein
MVATISRTRIESTRALGVTASDWISRHDKLERQNRQLKLRISHLLRLVYIDELTGLVNRRCLDRTLGREIRRATRSKSPLTVILCDIDHFKRYNDALGPQAGDTVLRMLGHAIRSSINRAGDLAARFGGEEFAMLLQGTGPLESLAFAESLRRTVEKLTLPIANGGSPRNITISIGVTTFHSASPCRPAALIKCADEALYFAKGSGRNCTKFCAINPSTSLPTQSSAAIGVGR